MLKFIVDFIILLTSTAIPLVLNYYQIPTPNLQRISLGLAVLLMISAHFLSSHKAPSSFLKYSLLFFLSLTLQLMIFSTGGFKSPFLPLYHLFAITISFLIGLKVGISFLILSVGGLLINIRLDEKTTIIFKDDPGTIILYVLSFIVLIPIYHLVVSRYNLKDNLSKFLDQQLKLSKIRQKTILGGISEFVVITDLNLRILSFNETVERTLQMSSSELINRPLFDILFLKKANGALVGPKDLSVDQIVVDKSTRINSNLFLYSKNKLSPKKVIVKVRPAEDLQGKIDQIIFIVSEEDKLEPSTALHLDLETAFLQYEAKVAELRKTLDAKGLVDLKIRTDLMRKTEKDLITASEIQDHGVKPNLVLKDIAEVVKHTVAQEQEFVKNLKLPISLVFDTKYSKDAASLAPKGVNVPLSVLTAPYFTAPIDPKWLDLLLQKLIDIAILLTSSEPNPLIQVQLSYDQKIVYITVMFTSHLQQAEWHRLLFTQYYGILQSKTNLKYGSGLEGYVAKILSQFQNLPLSVKTGINPPSLSFVLHIPKQAKI